MMDNLTLLVLLLLTHIIGDFYLQPNSWVTDRYLNRFKSKYLIVHSAIHTVLVALVLMLSDCSPLQVLLGVLIVGLSHYIIDLGKAYCPRKAGYFFLDQALHVLVITFVWFQLTDTWHYIDPITQLISHYKVITVLIAYLLVLAPSSVVISMLLNRWSDFSRNTSLLSAGKTIGMIERCLILTFILLNQFAGVGFLLAAKSVFRFGDLKENKDQKMTEYVMLGTLISVMITLLIGIITVLIIQPNIIPLLKN